MLTKSDIKIQPLVHDIMFVPLIIATATVHPRSHTAPMSPNIHRGTLVLNEQAIQRR